MLRIVREELKQPGGRGLPLYRTPGCRQHCTYTHCNTSPFLCTLTVSFLWCQYQPLLVCVWQTISSSLRAYWYCRVWWEQVPTHAIHSTGNTGYTPTLPTPNPSLPWLPTNSIASSSSAVTDGVTGCRVHTLPWRHALRDTYYFLEQFLGLGFLNGLTGIAGGGAGDRHLGLRYPVLQRPYLWLKLGHLFTVTLLQRTILILQWATSDSTYLIMCFMWVNAAFISRHVFIYRIYQYSRVKLVVIPQCWVLLPPDTV